MYVLAGGKKRHIPNPTIFNTCGYQGNDKVPVSDVVLGSIPTGTPVYGPACPYALMRGTTTPDPVYVKDDARRKHIGSAAAFNGCGYIWADIVQISDAALNSVPTGVTINRPPCPYTRQ